MNDQLTPDNMQLNELPPPGFCNEPRTISSEVAQLKREVSAMREALLRLVEVLQQKPEPPINKEAV